MLLYPSFFSIQLLPLGLSNLTKFNYGLILCHVSAHSLIALSTLKHHYKAAPEDKQIWDAAYDAEFDGLNTLPTWELINEEQFR
jgi:hypothetical protein